MEHRGKRVRGTAFCVWGGEGERERNADREGTSHEAWWMGGGLKTLGPSGLALPQLLSLPPTEHICSHLQLLHSDISKGTASYMLQVVFLPPVLEKQTCRCWAHGAPLSHPVCTSRCLHVPAGPGLLCAGWATLVHFLFSQPPLPPFSRLCHF